MPLDQDAQSSPETKFRGRGAKDTVLAVEDLSKTYISFKKEAGVVGSMKAVFRRESVAVPAVKNLRFEIARGEFVGLLGPNGAGKTTTLKMLTGLIRPTGGRALAFETFDTATRSPHYLRRIGMVMGQRNQLNPDLPAADSFRLAQAIYDIDETRFQRRLKECLDLFAIEDKVLMPVRKLSLGERMKMELILAIIHEPELLFLDEPTIGLDFNAARQIRGFLADANKKLGITVVLTSHYTKDIEELCRRVVLINHGRIVYDGALAGMDTRLKGQKKVTLFFADRAPLNAARAALVAMQAAGAAIAMQEDVKPETDAEDATDRLWPLAFDVGTEAVGIVLSQLLAGVDPTLVRDVRIGERELDEIFAEIYRKPSET